MVDEEYDFLIVGAGFFGSICAYELNKRGFKVVVIDNRNHIGGNCFTQEKDNINIHMYGPHIFHTSNKAVWDYINKFCSFNNFVLNVIANYKNEIFPLPFNMFTFSKLWNISTPEEAKEIINEQNSNIIDPKNFEEQAIKNVGIDIYNKLIKGYTMKQWMKDPKELPKEIIQRIPVRYTYNNNYFNDNYQGIPIGGYTKIFENLLKDIPTLLNVDFFKDNLPKHKKIIYTGPIDKFFQYKHGQLEYKTTEFIHKKKNKKNFQGNSIINYTDKDVEYTRIIEHKHFENSISDISWVTFEYPRKYIANKTDPYYPVNDYYNNNIYAKYKEESEKFDNIYFGGRLAEYKYYDMDKVIESALNFINKNFPI